MAASTDPVAWVAKADHDLLNIANNLTAGETPPYTHDLVRLLATCLSHDQSLTDIESDCIALAAYGVFPQYPDDVDRETMFAVMSETR